MKSAAPPAGQPAGRPAGQPEPPETPCTTIEMPPPSPPPVERLSNEIASHWGGFVEGFAALKNILKHRRTGSADL